MTVLFRLNAIPINTEHYERKLVIKKSTKMETMMKMLVEKFGIGEPKENHQFCLNYVSSKGKEIRRGLFLVIEL